MEQRRGKWDIVVSQPIICNANGIFENCTFVTGFIDICDFTGTGSDIGTGLDIGTVPDIGTVLARGSDIILRFTDRFVGTFGFFDYGGCIGTRLIISVVDTFTDNGFVITGCRREALHRSHRCSRHQPRRADQRREREIVDRPSKDQSDDEVAKA